MNLNTFLSLLICLTLFACSKDDDDCCDSTNPDCSNYDPCHNAQQVSAAFDIHEAHWGFPNEWEEYDTDTLYGVDIRFTALLDDAIYTWIIGADTIRTQTAFKKQFPQGEDIPITLIVEKEPNTLCFPNDDGKDTLTRTIYIWPLKTPLPFEGTYRGYNLDDENNVFEITIDLNLTYTGFPTLKEASARFTGFFPDCGMVYLPHSSGLSAGFRQVYFDFRFAWENDCEFTNGLAKFNGNEVNIDYLIGKDRVDSSPRILKQFKGVRVN